MLASPDSWASSSEAARSGAGDAASCIPYLPYPRFLRDLHAVQDLAEVALPHRLRTLAQRLLNVHAICVLGIEQSAEAARWRDTIEGPCLLEMDAQHNVALPCGFMVPTLWLAKAYRSTTLQTRQVEANQYLLAMAVRGTGDVMALLIVSQQGKFQLAPAIREALPHLCRAVGTAWENRALRQALSCQYPPSPHVSHSRPSPAASRPTSVPRERSLRRRALEAEAVAHFLANTSTLLGTSLDYNTTLKQALRLAIPYLGSAAQLDMLLPNHRVARWRGRLSRDNKADVCLARVVEMDDTDARFALQHRALPSLGATFVTRNFGRQQVMLPLYSRGKILGVLTVVRTMHLGLRRRANSSLCSLIECFGRRVAAALDNAQLHAQLMRAVRVRNDFLAMASHELRTPVMAMSLKLEHALRSLKAGQASHMSGEALKEYMVIKLTGALQCSDRLTQLVANLVDVSHLRAEHMTLTRGNCSLSECVTSVLTMYQEQFSRRGCKLMAHIEDNVCGFWDRQRIEQIVGHLVGNAIKYGAGRPIELIVARFKGMAILRVTDQGIGITPDSVERIFGRFERATSIRSYGGFGLGLYITREIISAHGGVLEVISTPEQGASFEVHLPLSCRPQLPSRPARTPTGAAPI